MRLLSVVTARSLWFVPAEDLNPRGLDLMPILAGIRFRYLFQEYPTKPEDIYSPPDGIRFSRGSFALNDGQRVEIINAKIYRDGIVADTGHSTDVSDVFISDVLTYLSHSHRLFFDPDMVRRKAYLSELVVSVDTEMEMLNEGFRQFCALLEEVNGEGREFHPVSVRFGTDPTTGTPLQFTFERRAQSPFTENRYFSVAPLTTDKHIEILEAWERVMAGQ